MDRFKVLPLETYNEVVLSQHSTNEEVTEKISKLSKFTANKLKKFLQFLKENGVDVDKNGEEITEKVFQRALYCIQGKMRPDDMDDFLLKIKHLKFPNGILANKVVRELKLIKRRVK